jgi:hypothetical protein
LTSLTQWPKLSPLLLLQHLLRLVLQTPLPLLKRKRKKKKKLASTVLDPFSVETGIERRRAHLVRDMLASSEAR